MQKPIILTGIRANNNLTLGNYLGALLPIVDMATRRAGEYQINLFVPDLHSFTTPVDHGKLHEQIMQAVRIFVAAGLPIEHKDVYVYRQSYISAHSELTWILDCFTGFGEMRRMTQFKDKAKITGQDVQAYKAALVERVMSRIQGPAADPSRALSSDDNQPAPSETLRQDIHTIIEEALATNIDELISSSVGLFNYPVLMAADVLLYGAQYVPVGDDQTQHLEFMRDIAMRLNEKFADIFPKGLLKVPLAVAKQHEFFGKDQGLRVRDLLDPTKKMSKSDETGRGVIFLSDTPEAAAKKIMGATTDSYGKIHFDMKTQPGVSNLLQILCFLTGRKQNEVISEWEGKASYGELKKAAAESVSRFLIDFQARLAMVDDQAILQKLEASEEEMNKVANRTLFQVQQAVGLRSL